MVGRGEEAGEEGTLRNLCHIVLPFAPVLVACEQAPQVPPSEKKKKGSVFAGYNFCIPVAEKQEADLIVHALQEHLLSYVGFYNSSHIHGCFKITANETTALCVHPQPIPSSPSH